MTSGTASHYGKMKPPHSSPNTASMAPRCWLHEQEKSRTTHPLDVKTCASNRKNISYDCKMQSNFKLKHGHVEKQGKPIKDNNLSAFCPKTWELSPKTWNPCLIIVILTKQWMSWAFRPPRPLLNILILSLPRLVMGLSLKPTAELDHNTYWTSYFDMVRAVSNGMK